MWRLKKVLLISSILSWFAIGFVVADNTDCGVFWIFPYSQWWSADNGFSIVDAVWETDSNPYSNFLTVDQQKKILTKNDLNTARINLKKYCCEHNNLWWLANDTCKNDQPFFNSNALDSPYLFDHIFDVMMRRLNWLTGDNDIYTKTNMTVDDKWEKRREWISDKAEDLSWSDVQSVIDAYKKYWTKGDYDITQQIEWTFHLDDQSFLGYISWQKWDESKEVSEMIANYDKWTLYDRYENVCALSKYFYSLLNQGKSTDKTKIFMENSNWSCEKIVKAQIDAENQYVQLVSQRASNLFLSNYIEWYVEYLYSRWNEVKSQWKNITDRFLDIIRAVPQLVKQSVK